MSTKFKNKLPLLHLFLYSYVPTYYKPLMACVGNRKRVRNSDYVERCVLLILDNDKQRTAFKKRRLNSNATPHRGQRFAILLNDIAPSRLDEKPSLATLGTYRSWMTRYHNNPHGRKVLLGQATVLNLHEDFRDCILEPLDQTGFSDLFDVFHVGQAEIVPPVVPLDSYSSFSTLLRVLLNRSNHKTVDKCGDISEDSGFCYCTGNADMRQRRLLLLDCTGFKHTESLRVRLPVVPELMAGLRRLRARVVSNKQGRLTLEGVSLLHRGLGGDMDRLNTMTGEHLLDVINLIGTRREASTAYRILAGELASRNRPKVLRFLQSKLKSHITGINSVDRFRMRPLWFNTLLDEALENDRVSSSGSTSFPKVLLKKRASAYVRIINFLDQHLAQVYVEQIKEHQATSNPLVWFFDTCSVEMIKEVAVAYGTTIEPQNERVKKANSTHQAQNVVSMILRFFKIGINDRLACKHDVQSLMSGRILHLIRNKRIQRDEQPRRTFTDEEVESMFAVVNCKKGTLILTIF
jgi:hypothetical protein